ncbi:3445_t:CDS:2, partial [Entrophospora sp. SA101]
IPPSDLSDDKSKDINSGETIGAEKRRPDITSTSTAKHMATCVSKQVTNCPPIPIEFNRISIHNPVNIDANNLCLYLTWDYHGIFDIPYNQRKDMWTQKSILMNFDEIECLTIHSYDDAIKERKEERSMNGVQLIGIEERQLHSMQDYLEGLKMITSINKDVDAHDLDSFKEAFQKSKRYPYTMSDLEYLSEKTILFLLNYFQQIYKNLGLLGGSAVKKGSYPIYNYLEIGQPICYPHCLAIAEPDRYTCYKNTEIPPSDLSDDKSKDINKKRRPDTTSTSTAKYMAMCVSRQVTNCPPIPIEFNRISIHNPVNIDPNNLCLYLTRDYHGIFDIPYNQRKDMWTQKSILMDFDEIECLTIHSFDDAIKERKEERSMNDVGHLQHVVAPVVADCPGQLFIRKALTYLHSNDPLLSQSVPKEINCFLPILGPLHVSLNSREQ